MYGEFRRTADFLQAVESAGAGICSESVPRRADSTVIGASYRQAIDA